LYFNLVSALFDELEPKVISLQKGVEGSKDGVGNWNLEERKRDGMMRK